MMVDAGDDAVAMGLEMLMKWNLKQWLVRMARLS